MCLLRLIASFEGFRKAAFGASLSLLLGMPLMTFEKFLREEHAIEFRAGAGRSVTLLSGGGVVRQYEDDKLSSITGQLVFQLRALYPEADPLFSSPLVQTVRGASVDSILRGFDLSDVFDNFVGVEGAQEQLRDFDVSAFNNVAEALLDDNPANFLKNRAVDMLYQLVVAARTSDPQVVVGDPTSIQHGCRKDFLEFLPKGWKTRIFWSSRPFHWGIPDTATTTGRGRGRGSRNRGRLSWDRPCGALSRSGRKLSSPCGEGNLHLWVPRGQGVHRSTIPEEEKRSLQAPASWHVSGRGSHHACFYRPQTRDTGRAHRRTVGSNGRARVLIQKGGWDTQVDGEWTRRLGPI